jgi:hypothetical protein
MDGLNILKYNVKADKLQYVDPVHSGMIAC